MALTNSGDYELIEEDELTAGSASQFGNTALSEIMTDKSVDIDIFKAFLRAKSFIPNQLSSYDDMIIHQIPRIIEQSPPTIIELPSKKKGDKTIQKYTVTFSNIYFDKPKTFYTQDNRNPRPVYPHEAKNRNMTYSSTMFVDIDVDGPRGRRRYERQFFGNIPVMVKSGMCNLYDIRNSETELYAKCEDPNDLGGYFILGSKKGTASEKVVICQEKMCINRIALYNNPKKTKVKMSPYATISSRGERSFYQKTLDIGFTGNLIYASLRYLPEKNMIPIGILFRALGATTEKHIVSHIVYEQDKFYIQALELLLPSLEYVYSYQGQEECLEFIGRKGKKFDNQDQKDSPEESEAEEINPAGYDSGELEEMEEELNGKNKPSKQDQTISYANYLISSEILPHMGKSHEKKRLFLGYMVRKLIMKKLGLVPEEDRDHYMNKRVSMVGDLMAGIFSSIFVKTKLDMKKNIEKRGPDCVVYGNINVVDYLKPKSFIDQYSTCLGSGNWGAGKYQKQGVSQVLERVNYVSCWAHLRRIVTPVDGQKGKVEEPRRLHNSSWFFTCPSETPESKKCGLVKALSLMCYISLGTSPEPIRRILKKLRAKKLTKVEPADTKIFLNGRWQGGCDFQDRERFFTTFKRYKLSGQISEETSVVIDRDLNEIRLSTEMGRFIRPALVVANGEVQLMKKHVEDIKEGRMEWKDLIYEGIIELLDPEEVDSPQTLIAVYIKDVTGDHTHCEIHPALMYGLGGTLICCPECNQSPRVCYQCCMVRQAYNRPCINYMHRSGTKQHVLNYLHRPLMPSRFAEVFGDCGYGGNNAMVAIMNYRGYGQEDSIIINEQSVQRGLFDTMCYVDYRTQIKKHEKQKLEIPSSELCHETVGKVRDILNKVKEEEKDGFITFHSKNYKNAITQEDKVPYAVAKVGSVVYKGDIVIGKLKQKSPKILQRDEKPYKNESIVFKDFDVGRVCAVQYGYDGDDFFYVNVKIAEVRFPEIGDKWASKISQKGTCGLMAKEVDLPFSGDSHSAPYPDLILNPLAFPSRMTISHLIEALGAKKVCASHRKKFSLLGKYEFFKIQHCDGTEELKIVDDFYYEDQGNVKKVPQKLNKKKLWVYIRKKLLLTRALLEVSIIEEVTNKGFSCGTASYTPVTKENVPPKVLKNFYHDFGISHAYGEDIENGTAYEPVSQKKLKLLDLPPNSTKLDIFREELKRMGHEPQGHQKLYCGMTGEPMEALIYFAPTYYQRLKYIVSDKMHARARGPKQALNRQPQEGRANDGGLRCGEMERDCFLAQAAAYNTREMLLDKSDKFNIFVCRHCGLFAINNKVSGIKECRVCDVEGDDHIVEIQLPYTTALAFRELISMNVVPRILTQVCE